MPEKQKITRLSSRFLGPLRWVLFVLYSVIIVVLVILFLQQGWIFGIFQSAFYIYGFYWLMKMTNNLQQVSFDSEFLHVFRKTQDLIIPLESIESVEISSLGGVYKVNLYYPEQLGKEFFFKTSLLYPLNYKSKDELVNLLRKNISMAKSKRQVIAANALTS